jgi:hypothetical protein
MMRERHAGTHCRFGVPLDSRSDDNSFEREAASRLESIQALGGNEYEH